MKSFRLHHKLFLLPSCTKHLSLHLFRISFGHIKKHGYCLSHVLTSPYLRKRMTFGLEFIYCTLGFKHVLDLKVVRLIGRLGWLVPENPFLQTLSSFKKVLLIDCTCRVQSIWKSPQQQQVLQNRTQICAHFTIEFWGQNTGARATEFPSFPFASLLGFITHKGWSLPAWATDLHNQFFGSIAQRETQRPLKMSGALHLHKPADAQIFAASVLSHMVSLHLNYPSRILTGRCLSRAMHLINN